MMTNDDDTDDGDDSDTKGGGDTKTERWTRGGKIIRSIPAHAPEWILKHSKTTGQKWGQKKILSFNVFFL